MQGYVITIEPHAVLLTVTKTCIAFYCCHVFNIFTHCFHTDSKGKYFVATFVVGRKHLFFLIWALASHLVCGATGALCFGLWLTLPMGLADAPSPALCSRVCLMILRANSDYPGLVLVPILHLGMVRVLHAKVTTQCHFQDGWQIWAHNLVVQSSTLYRLVW